jgi:hypothetical protein
MRSIRLILAVFIFGGVLMAENPDPFAAYRQAFDNQLSTMLDRHQIAKSEVREPVPVPQMP